MDQLNERVAYLKGLAEGLKIDKDKDEGKLLAAIIDVLDEMASAVGAVQTDLEDVEDLVDEIDEDLSYVEDEVYGEYDDSCDCGCEEDEDVDFYEVECPNCKEKIYLDEETLCNEDEIVCPNCKEHIEIEVEDECDCGCEHGEEE